MTRIVVFSDLDGALLDEETFDWVGARDTLAWLRDAHIPLVFVSSKTRAEIAALRERLDNRDPYAAENGALLVREDRPDQVLGRPAAELLDAARALASETDTEMELLADMPRRRILEVTRLPESHLHLALAREHSAPFLLHRGSVVRLTAAARAHRLRIVPGRRLLHLVGDHDKGDAVRLLRRDHPDAAAIAIGDGPNDEPMMHAVDQPVFQGTRPPPGLPAHTILEPATGPAAWSRALRQAIENVTALVAQGGDAT